MKKLNLKTEVMIWILILLPLILYAVLRDKLPAVVTTHYNFRGEADHFESPFNFALEMSGVGLFVYLVILLAPYFDPKKKKDAHYGRFYPIIRIAIPLFIALVVGYEFVHAMGYTGSNNMVFITLLILILFVVMGNYLNSIGPNWVIGYRTPWTLSNDEVWKRTHRLGSKLMFYSALAGLFLFLVIPASYLVVLLSIVVFIGAIVPMIYSFIIYKQLEK